MDDAVIIKLADNGLVLDEDHLFQFRNSGDDQREQIEKCLNMALERLGLDSWKVKVEG